MLNKQKGNMYGFVTHTWNPIKGKCIHDCKYCYMKVYKQKPLHLVEKELKDDLGEGNFIFVGSSTDMFAVDVSYDWIMKVLEVCRQYPKNKYLFQTKSPSRIKNFYSEFPKNSIIGTTLETNRKVHSFAPITYARAVEMSKLEFDKMVTIEPIYDFDLYDFLLMIKDVKPKWVNIGADSKGHNLPEPSKKKIEALIKELKKFTEVRLKPNLKRLYSQFNENKKEAD